MLASIVVVYIWRLQDRADRTSGVVSTDLTVARLTPKMAAALTAARTPAAPRGRRAVAPMARDRAAAAPRDKKAVEDRTVMAVEVHTEMDEVDLDVMVRMMEPSTDLVRSR